MHIAITALSVFGGLGQFLIDPKNERSGFKGSFMLMPSTFQM